MKVVLAVHGGAGRRAVNQETYVTIKNVLEQALLEGFRVYKSGSSLDMVVAAIEVLENSGIFNAGIGSTVDASGSISMDAGLMFRGKAGAVACVRYPKNPIKLARFVLERTEHVIIAGGAADKLARKIGLEPHPGPLQRVLELYSNVIIRLRRGERVESPFQKSLETWLSLGDTVGAVSIDRDGILAAGVSTGGVFLKMPGRVGDSAIPGAGFYANECGAAIATGIGEYILLTHATLKIVEEMCNGAIPSDAVKKVLNIVTNRFGSNTAGFIALDNKGRVAGLYNTQMMPWGYISEEGNVKILGI